MSSDAASATVLRAGGDPPPGRPSSGGPLVARLSAMMFLQYWPLGLWAVTSATYIAANTGASGAGIFSPGFMGYAMTAGAIGSLVAPIVAGWIADRFVAAEWVLLTMHAVCAVTLWIMHEADVQATFYAALLVYWQAFGPTVALTNTIALRQLRDPEGEFGAIRVFGTVAWISAGVFVGVIAAWWNGESIEPTRVPFAIAAVSHAVMVVYALTLPSTPPAPRRAAAVVDSNMPSVARSVDTLDTGRAVGELAESDLLPGDQGESDPSGEAGSAWTRIVAPLAPFLAISVVAAAMSQPYNVANLFLNQQGYAGAAATLTIGQLTELLCLGLMPLWVRRFGVPRLFVFGVAMWGVRYALLGAAYVGQPGVASTALVLSAIFIHGPAYVFVYITGAMYVAQRVGDEAQGAAQGLHTVATGGLGHVLGGLSVAWAQAVWLTPDGVDPPPYHWAQFWITPAAIGLALAVITFAVLKPWRRLS